MTDHHEVFCVLIREHRNSLFRVARSILRSDADAEDAVGEATVKAYINFGRLRKLGSFKPWIMRIVVNEAYAIAKKRRHFESLENVPEDTPGPTQTDSMALWSAVGQLSDEFRAVTVLFYYEDMSIREIGRILGIPVGTVNSRLNRAREKLRVILKD